jgi:uncharacterized protein (DUF58 family)
MSVKYSHTLLSRWVNRAQWVSALTPRAELLILLSINLFFALALFPSLLLISCLSVPIALLGYALLERAQLESVLEKIELDINLPNSIKRGEIAEVSITLKNPTSVSIQHLSLRLRLTNGQSPIIKRKLPAHQQGVIKGELLCNHLNDGMIWGCEVLAEDHFGLITAERHFLREHRITVIPQASISLPQPSTLLSTNKSTSSKENNVNRIRGHEGDFVELRSYQPSDHIRRIAWRASARRGKLLTQVFENTFERKYILALDLNPLMRARLLTEHRSDLAIDLLHHELNRLKGAQVGVIVFDHRILAHLPIASQSQTRQRFHKIERYLARPLMFDCVAETQDELWDRLSNYLTWIGKDYEAHQRGLDREPHLSPSLRLKDTLNKEFMSQWLLEQEDLQPLSYLEGIGMNDIDQRLRQFCYDVGITSTPCLPRPLHQMNHGLSQLMTLAKNEEATDLSIISHSHRLQSNADLSLLKAWVNDRRALTWIQTACVQPQLPKILSPLASSITYTPILLTSDRIDRPRSSGLHWLT